MIEFVEMYAFFFLFLFLSAQYLPLSILVNRIHFGFDNVKYQNTFMTLLHCLLHH